MLAGRRESMGEPRPDNVRAPGGWATAVGVHSCFSNVCGDLHESALGGSGIAVSAADRGSTVRFGTVVGCAARVYDFTCPSAVEGPSHPAKPSHATRGSTNGRKSRTPPTCRGRGCRRVAATAKGGRPMCGRAGTPGDESRTPRCGQPSDWEFALDTIELVARAAEDDAPVSLISDIRLRERTLGTTWDAGSRRESAMSR
jgi:hypothetical protein